MKKVLFGIALILFTMLLYSIDPWLWIFGTDWFYLLLGLAGLVIAGIGAFTKDK